MQSKPSAIPTPPKSFHCSGSSTPGHRDEVATPKSGCRHTYVATTEAGSTEFAAVLRE